MDTRLKQKDRHGFYIHTDNYNECLTKFLQNKERMFEEQRLIALEKLQENLKT